MEFLFLPISELSQPASTDSVLETRIEFPDNRLLIDLFGEFNRNLAQIEEALSVQIVHTGNQLAVFGEAGAIAKASDVLQGLYARVEAGRGITPGDIDAEIRMGGSKVAPGGAPADQMEMFQGGKVEIKTRKKLVEPRTEAQKAYVRALYANELCFGIGPAGTGKTYLAVAVGVNMFIAEDGEDGAVPAGSYPESVPASTGAEGTSSMKGEPWLGFPPGLRTGIRRRFRAQPCAGTKIGTSAGIAA